MTKLLTTKQAAEYLNLSLTRIIQLCGQGRLGKKFGRDYLITLEELVEFAKIPRVSGRPAIKPPEGEK